jgi:hypothetical protein
VKCDHESPGIFTPESAIAFQKSFSEKFKCHVNTSVWHRENLLENLLKTLLPSFTFLLPPKLMPIFIFPSFRPALLYLMFVERTQANISLNMSLGR